MTSSVFEWERPLVELENRIQELQAFVDESGIDLSAEIATLREKADKFARGNFCQFDAVAKGAVGPSSEAANDAGLHRLHFR